MSNLAAFAKGKVPSPPAPATEGGGVPKFPSTSLPRISARVSKASERRIRELALDEDCTVQDLIVRGLSALLIEKGLPPLAESSDG